MKHSQKQKAKDEPETPLRRLREKTTPPRCSSFDDIVEIPGRCNEGTKTTPRATGETPKRRRRKPREFYDQVVTIDRDRERELRTLNLKKDEDMCTYEWLPHSPTTTGTCHKHSKVPFVVVGDWCDRLTHPLFWAKEVGERRRVAAAEQSKILKGDESGTNRPLDDVSMAEFDGEDQMGCSKMAKFDGEDQMGCAKQGLALASFAQGNFVVCCL